MNSITIESKYTFQAGDEVRHGPSGECWLLATDEEYGRVFAVGWPETLALTQHLTLIKSATPEKRLEMLQAVAKGYGTRSTWASRQLERSGAL